MLLLAAGQQSTLPPELVHLARIKQRMAANLARVPNYTCLAVIEREQQNPAQKTLQPFDTIKVEVALVQGAELFGWPGGGRLEATNLRQMVPTGLVSTGEYANHLRSIFQTNVAQFQYVGEEEAPGRRLLRYDFRVSLLNSDYQLSFGDRSARVPYRGSFWADSDTYDVARLEVRVEEIPPELGIGGAVTTADYARVRIGTADFLLPQTTELLVERMDGSASRNRTTFQKCRQYSTESVVRFDLPTEEPAAGPHPPPPAVAKLPPGLLLTLELQVVLDSSTTRPGDQVRASLVQDVVSLGQTVVPAGTTVLGRVVEFLQPLETVQLGRVSTQRPRPEFRVKLQFTDILLGSGRVPFTAVLEKLPENRRIHRYGRNPGPGEASFLVRQGQFRLPQLIMDWKTQ